LTIEFINKDLTFSVLAELRRQAEDESNSYKKLSEGSQKTSKKSVTEEATFDNLVAALSQIR